MNARKEALLVLDRVMKSGSYSNIAVDTVLGKKDATEADRSLFCMLVYGVIERKITLDYIIDTLSTLPPSKIELTTRNLLRMGLYQLIYTDRIPAHAAVNETVSLCGTRSRGFVNALLRSYLRGRESFPFPTADKDLLSYLSVTYSFPVPLCRKIREQYGEETEEILASFSKAPGLSLRVNTLKISREELAARLAAKGCVPQPLENVPFGLSLSEGSPRDIGLEEGLCFVQDEASQISTAVLAADPGDTVIDMCACPGSKSFGAAMTMENKGRILSFDIHENKLSLVEKTAARLGISILETAAADGRVPRETLFGIADKIICDVPCSGYGVVAKKPEIRYKDPDDTRDLPAIGLAILSNAARYIKSGGRIVYSTCTIFREENEDNVRAFLEDHPDFSLCPFEVGNIHAPQGMITLLPSRHGTDGFFIANLIKN